MKASTLILVLSFGAGYAFGQGQAFTQPATQSAQPSAIPAAAPPVKENAGESNAEPPFKPENDIFLRARQSVDKFFEQFSSIVCTEKVDQFILGGSGKPLYREEASFDYQLQAAVNVGSVELNETRQSRRSAFHDAGRTLLITNNFASMLLVLHSSYETSYIFDSAGQEELNGIKYAKYGFKAVPGAASPVAFQLRGKNYPVPLTGTVWIDSQNGTISKLIAVSAANFSDMGLNGLRSEIHYGTARIHNPEELYQMPTSAVIDVETAKHHWQNVHNFSDCRRLQGDLPHAEGFEAKP